MLIVYLFHNIYNELLATLKAVVLKYVKSETNDIYRIYFNFAVTCVSNHVYYLQPYKLLFTGIREQR